MNTHIKLNVDARRAIEALRNGVPNRFAVAALGTWQSDAEARFREACNAVSTANAGMIVRGDFGTGKSHLLMALREYARRQGFATAMVVVSKELPLGNPGRLVPRILAAMELPDMAERGLPVIATRLKFDTPSYGEFTHWLHDWEFGEGWWPATLALFETLRGADELLDDIARFWAGESALSSTVVRKHLKEAGLAGRYTIAKAPSGTSLAWQRLAFGAHLCCALGLRGLVVLIDEIELIAQYTRLQRVQSYRVLGNLNGSTLAAELHGAPLVVIGAVTRDFEDAVFSEKGDADEAVGVAREKFGEEAARAVATGMNAIRNAVALVPPSEAVVDQLRAKVTELYHQAYPAWTPRTPRPVPLYATTTARTIIRRWVTEWDLARYYGSVGEITETNIGATPTEEDVDLLDDGPASAE